MYYADGESSLNDLVTRAVQGDRRAVGQVLSHIRPMVVRYCRARLGNTGGGAYTTADDVAQEVCIAVLNALPRYRDMGRPFTAFVFGIASHKVTDAHRGAKRDLSQPHENVPDREDNDRGPESRAIASDTAREVYALLTTLPENHREVLMLRIAVGMSAEEAGEVLGMTPGAVRVTQHRALVKLRQRVSDSAEVVA